MTTDSAPELSRPVKSPTLPVSTDRLWPWYLATASYLAFIGLIVFDRWGEIGSLFDAPEPGENRLPLHNIGDLLAGIFAPLAFLWLFVATQLQRRELRLQREELADTRAVLAEQREELALAAKESNLQTEIMRETLNQGRFREKYEYLNLTLYYMARNISMMQSEGILIEKYSKPSSYQAARWGRFHIPILPTVDFQTLSMSDVVTVDNFFRSFYSATKGANQTIRHLEYYRFASISRYKSTLRDIEESISLISSILDNENFKSSALAASRISSLQMEDIRAYLIGLLDLIRDYAGKSVEPAESASE